MKNGHILPHRAEGSHAPFKLYQCLIRKLLRETTASSYVRNSSCFITEATATGCIVLRMFLKLSNYLPVLLFFFLSFLTFKARLFCREKFILLDLGILPFKLHVVFHIDKRQTSLTLLVFLRVYSLGQL